MGHLKKASKPTKSERLLAMAQATTPKHSDRKFCFKFYIHTDTVQKWYSTEMHRWTQRTTHGPTTEHIKWATDIVDALHQLEQDIGKIDHEYRTDWGNGWETVTIARRERKDMRTEEISARQYSRRCNHEW